MTEENQIELMKLAHQMTNDALESKAGLVSSSTIKAAKRGSKEEDGGIESEYRLVFDYFLHHLKGLVES